MLPLPTLTQIYNNCAAMKAFGADPPWHSLIGANIKPTVQHQKNITIMFQHVDLSWLFSCCGNITLMFKHVDLFQLFSCCGNVTLMFKHVNLSWLFSCWEDVVIACLHCRLAPAIFMLLKTLCLHMHGEVLSWPFSRCDNISWLQIRWDNAEMQVVRWGAEHKYDVRFW